MLAEEGSDRCYPHMTSLFCGDEYVRMSAGSTRISARKISQTVTVANDQAHDWENHILLRVPDDIAPKVDAILEDDNSGGMAIQFLSKRLANVRIGNQVLSAKLYDLPAITEVMKTTNRKTIYKVADLSQVMVCSHELCAIPPAEKKLSKKKEAKRWQYPDGLTPPMKSVRKRRFRKTKKKKYMEAPEVERELKRLLRADMESSSFRWEIVDSDGKVVYESDQPCTSVISSTQEGTTVSEGALCERDSFDEHEFRFE